MKRHRSRWLAIAVLVATCLGGILVMVTLGGFDAPASGDGSASSYGPASLTLFFMGVLLLLGAKILRMRSLRARARHPSRSAPRTQNGATVRI
jgi:hypothetical protein